MNKRDFLQALGLGLVAIPLLSQSGTAAVRSSEKILKGKKLQAGATIGLIAPASALDEEESISQAREVFESLGFQVKEGAHIRARYGNLAGSDEERLADLHAMFADPQVQAIVCLRGGTGASRLLDRIDYDLIAKNAKPFLGYSDVTALLLAFQAKVGLVGFHGAVGTSTWNTNLATAFNRQFISNEQQQFRNPVEKGDNLIVYKDRIRTLHSGRVEGRLLGGNLTLITGLCGTAYLPDFKGAILFVEEVEEDMSRMERMFCQLKNAGILQDIAGFIFGNCTACTPSKGYGSLTLQQLLADYIEPLKIPAYTGAKIGHIANQFILPVGALVRMDADQGTIDMLEKALL